MEEKKTLLSIRDLYVRFRVRGRILTAIRGVSLDIYENETIAIVGESGCGKSVLTKTFAGMLDNNGFIDQGDILFYDESATKVSVPLDEAALRVIQREEAWLDKNSRVEKGAELFRKREALKKDRERKQLLCETEEESFTARRKELEYGRTEAGNLLLSLDPKKDREEYGKASRKKKELEAALKALEKEKEALLQRRRQEYRKDREGQKKYEEAYQALTQDYQKAISGSIGEETKERNRRLAREIYLSVSRYPRYRQPFLYGKLHRSLKKAMEIGADLSEESQLNHLFEAAVFRVRLEKEEGGKLFGVTNLNLAKTSCVADWTDIRGNRIATIFQDPMTSLNPILTIGNQITSVIIRHQHVSEAEARKRAILLMDKVGIPDAENRFDDYPFQYSGGMRQRIVIAIALSCQPKILICDEPTTALDVTIQAQILKLIKDLQKEFHYTTVFITHDLGVVANVADRVAVLYAGQIVEVGTAEEVFYDPRHPYTWVLLSSLPQLSDRGEELYSIAGTPPSLYNRIRGDAFAPRNPYCMKIDSIKEPPMFRVTDTHYAKTWLLDPRAPKVEKPAIIQDIHGKLKEVFHIA